MIFRFMMFSERLEYGNYDFQHPQGTLRCVYGHQKSDVLRAYNEVLSGPALGSGFEARGTDVLVVKI